jgi:dihydroorotate dehydrogenase
VIDYRILRPLLIRLDPERAHALAITWLAIASHFTPLSRWLRSRYAARTPVLQSRLMGLHFANPVGLAAGFDKDARCLRALAALGFGHAELGTVTPRPQAGNPRPRLFRLSEHAAIINRMGFNSDGLEAFVRRLRRQRTGAGIVVGVNLGKNRETPLERAHEDYLLGLDAVHALADYVTLNVSSPNTRSLRDLQARPSMDRLLASLCERREQIHAESSRRVPLAVKIAPDLDREAIEGIVRSAIDHGVDAIIATNTTVTRPGLDDHPLAREDGGLSGAPLRDLATRTLVTVRECAGDQLSVVGAGGIGSVTDAWERFEAGADLVQIYSAFAYQGPGLPSALVRGLHAQVPASEATDFEPTLRRLHAARAPANEPRDSPGRS